MSIDVAGEVAACLEKAPGGDTGADQVKGWLFTSQNCVGVRLRRIVDDEDKTAHDLLTERAARTWGRVTNPEGKAQRLWARLSAELLPLVQGAADGLERRVDFLPEGMLAKIFPPETTCREVAALCYMCCESPLAIKADLIFPYHGAWMLLPGDRTVRKWTKWRYAVDAVEIPPVGDFVAAMVMNRLGMVKELLCTLARLRKEEIIQFTPESINWEHELGEKLRAVRNEIWDTPDAQERAGALALLQTYLLLAEYQRGFEADWSVIPWPAKPDNTMPFIIDRWEQRDLVPTEDRLYLCRSRALGCIFDGALKDRPGDVARIVKDGLEWLGVRLAALDATTEQPCHDNGPGAFLELADWLEKWAAKVNFPAPNKPLDGYDREYGLSDVEPRIEELSLWLKCSDRVDLANELLYEHSHFHARLRALYAQPITPEKALGRAMRLVKLLRGIDRGLSVAGASVAQADTKEHHRADDEQGKRPRMALAEATVGVREYLRKNKSNWDDITIRKVAESVGCSTGLVANTQPWKAFEAERKSRRKPKTPKAMALTDNMKSAFGQADTALTELIEGQEKNGNSDGSIAPYKDRSRSKFRPRRKP